MISWGITAAAMLFVRGAASFHALRFMLGVTEAGFFPGIIYYLTFWFPQRERARAIALFMTATSLAGVIAGPLSGALLTLHGTGGLSGWQWMFLVEGIPAVIMGLAVWRYLPDGPAEATWLTAGERDALLAILEEDSASRKLVHADLLPAILSARVWILTLFYFLFAFGLYGISFWLPQILEGLRHYERPRGRLRLGDSVRGGRHRDGAGGTILGSDGGAPDSISRSVRSRARQDFSPPRMPAARPSNSHASRSRRREPRHASGRSGRYRPAS